jgi:hypothetical protein
MTPKTKAAAILVFNLIAPPVSGLVVKEFSNQLANHTEGQPGMTDVSQGGFADPKQHAEDIRFCGNIAGGFCFLATGLTAVGSIRKNLGKLTEKDQSPALSNH